MNPVRTPKERWELVAKIIDDIFNQNFQVTFQNMLNQDKLDYLTKNYGFTQDDLNAISHDLDNLFLKGQGQTMLKSIASESTDRGFWY